MKTENQNIPGDLLVVEDDAGLNHLIRKTMERNGFRTHQALSGAEALKALRENPETILLLDYLLPDMNAGELINALHKENITVPLIVMTGHGDESIAVDIMKLGARDYIIKEPDFVSKLPRIIRQTVESIKNEKELALAEKVLQEQKKELESILAKFNKSQSIAKIGTLELDIISGKVWWSDELYRIFEVDPKKYIPSVEANAKFVHPDDNEPFHKAVFKAIETGEQIDYVIRIITPSGKLKNCRFLANIIFNENKIAVKMLGTFHDITDGKLAEVALRESEEKFSKAFKTSPYAITITCAEDGRFIEINDAFTSVAGYTREETLADSSIGLNLWVNEEDRNSVVTELHEGKSVNGRECQFRIKNGKIITGSISAQILELSSGLCILTSINDITERKRIEDQLHTTNQRLDTLLSSLYAGVLTTTKDGEVEHVNQAFCDLFNLTETPAGLRGLSSQEMLKKIGGRYSDPAKTLARIQDLIAKGKPIKGEEIAMRDGRFFLVDFIPIIDENGIGSGRIWHHQDITERKKAEEELRESKALVHAVVENVPLMVFLKEATDLRFVIFNRAGEELLGYDRAALLGKNNLGLFPAEQAAHFMAKDREVLDGEAGMLDIPEEPILTAKKGQRLLHTRKVCIRGADGTTKYLLGISEDITERKQAEENQKKLEEQLRQSQKLEAIGQLCSGVAHDFNNLLGGIMGHAELAKRDLAPESELQRHAAVIITLCEKAADLTRQLLSFARKAPVEFRKIDLCSFIKQIAELMKRTMDQSVEIEIDIKDKTTFISGDRNQLENALLNIAINARDAMPEGGRLCVTMETVTVDKTLFPEEQFEAIEGPYARISIADTGTGMNNEVKARIFEPFFTTKEIGKGTGLGLASVYGCVKQHNGYITVKSQEGKGTQFDLYFPIAASGPSTVPKEEGRLIPGKGSLLLVDDETVFQENLIVMFEPLGYTVHCCSDGVEAVEYFRTNNSTIDVVILDMNMPKMSGLQCFRRLKEINPNVKVIVSSGYGENEDRATMRTEGVTVFVQKPCSFAEMAKKIGELIKAP